MTFCYLNYCTQSIGNVAKSRFVILSQWTSEQTYRMFPYTHVCVREHDATLPID